MPRIVDATIFFITFALATVTLAACSHALVKRNSEIGNAVALSAATGVKVILSTNDLTQPGYALSTGACGIIINSLILLVTCFHVIPMSNFMRKTFILTPLFMVFNTLLSFGAAVAVTYAARHGRLSVYATLGGTVLPTSLFDAQAAKLGLSVYYWDKQYVKFMAIVPWLMIPFAIATTVLAFKYWREERPSAHRATNTGEVHHSTNPPIAHYTNEKGEIQHIA